MLKMLQISSARLNLNQILWELIPGIHRHTISLHKHTSKEGMTAVKESLEKNPTKAPVTIISIFEADSDA